MFELLGIASLSEGTAVPVLPAVRLPAAYWLDEGAYERHRIAKSGLRGVYLRRPSQVAAYHAEDNLHLFVIGEVYPRAGAANGKEAQRGPLPAAELFRRRQVAPTSFLEALKGNFTLLFIEPAAGRATLYTSRTNITPFYYAIVGGSLYFSTSFAALGRALPVTPDLDRVALAELALFHYPLGSRTYFEGVRKVCPAEVVRADAAGARREHWWHVRDLYEQPILSEGEALQEGMALFHRIVNDLVADLPRLNLALTAGFDSRAILAVLEMEPSAYRCYSFGIPLSLNVRIPQRMTRELGVPYQPIILDGAYEQIFDEHAMRAVVLSDCLATIERANYPYVFQQLGDYAPFVMTGLFGSELMRTFQNVGLMVSRAMANINLAKEPTAEVRRLLAEANEDGYFAPGVIASVADEVEAEVLSVLQAPYADMDPDRRLYMLLLTEAMRGYFGAELQMERAYVVNRFPYLDDEFVEFLFRSPFAGVHSRTLRPTIGSRFRSQSFYARLIQRYRPELLAAPTDHGYAPADLFAPLGLLRVGPKYVYWRWRRKRTGYREFKTEEWTESFYRRHLFQKPVWESLFSPRLKEDFRTGAWKANRIEFAESASLKIWLEAIGYGE